MKATTAALSKLFSQENDSSFSTYLSLETTSSPKIDSIFDNLNVEGQRLAALAFDSETDPIVILDAKLAHGKCSLLVLTKDLDLKVALLADTSSLDKSKAVNEIPIYLLPSYFQGVPPPAEGTTAMSCPTCLFPSEWINFMIHNDTLSTDSLKEKLAAKLSSMDSIHQQIPNSSIIQNMCTFLDNGNMALAEHLCLGPFAASSGNSRATQAMEKAFQEIVSELEALPNILQMENSIQDSVQQQRGRSTTQNQTPLSNEENLNDKNREDNNRKRGRENEKDQRKDDTNKDPKDSDSDIDSDSDESQIEVIEDNQTPSKHAQLEKMFNMDKFGASDKEISRNLKRQKLISEDGAVQGFFKSSRAEEYLLLCTRVNGRVETELNDTFLDIITRNKEKRDIARATRKATESIARQLRIDDRIQALCNKTADFILSGEPFINKEVLKEEDLEGFSFLSIPLANRSSITKNGAKYFLPVSVEELILQLRTFLAYCIILFSKNHSKETRGGMRDKNSGTCHIIRSLLEQVIDAKANISRTFESLPEARFDILRRIHNKFIKVIHSHVVRGRPTYSANLTCKVLEDIAESEYRPPQKDSKHPKDRDSTGTKDPNKGNRQNRGNQNGYFHFKNVGQVLSKAKANKDKIPKANDKPFCLTCSFRGTKKCKNKEKDALFHGPFTSDHEARMATFANAINEKIVKNNKRG